MKFDEAQKVFIVGAPKCGTTALHDYLGQHPDICASDPKEPNYFSSLIKSFPQTDKEYEEYCFKHWQGEKVLLEASPLYLVCRDAGEKIRKYSSSAKIIIMLRNPVEMMFSLHAEFLFTGLEKCSDFEIALLDEHNRITQANAYDNPEQLRTCYRYMSSYPDQVQRYLDRFKRENILFIFQEELSRNTLGTIDRVLSFLELPSYQAINTKRVNSRKVNRSKILRQFLVSPPPLLRRLGRSLIRNDYLQHSIRKKMRRLNQKINAKNTGKVELASDLRLSLLKEKESEILALEVLLGISLSDWKKQD